EGGLAGEAIVTVAVMPPMTLDLVPVADAFVDAGSPTVNFGVDQLLRIDANTTRNSYLRFAVSGIGTKKVARAILRLQADSGSAAMSDKAGNLHLITDNLWQERTVNWNTRPAVTGTPIVTMAGGVAVNQIVDFDVTTTVTRDGTYNFALVNPSSDGADYR